MKYTVKFTTSFKRNLKLMKKQGKDIDKLFAVVEKLADGDKLDTKYHEHNLSGNFVGCKECHIEPDWLLVYEYFDDVLVLVLHYTGSHSDVLKM